MSKKGLGKGLGALFGDAADEVISHDFEYLPLQRVEPNQDQPRKQFNEEKMQELIASISVQGVIAPIIVRKIDGGYYQIIAGERRWRASRELGLNQIPARIVEADDKKASEMALVDNLQRTDLNPIEEAIAYKQLMDEHEMTQEQVAERVSKSRPAVANSLRLLALPEELIGMLQDEKLSAGSARALLALKSEARIKDAAKMVVGNDMSVREVEALVRKLSKEKTSRTKKSGLDVSHIIDAQNRLTAVMGRRVTIKQGKSKGKIELEYYDLEDFDVLFDFLLAGEAGETK